MDLFIVPIVVSFALLFTNCPTFVYVCHGRIRKSVTVKCAHTASRQSFDWAHLLASSGLFGHSWWQLVNDKYNTETYPLRSNPIWLSLTGYLKKNSLNIGMNSAYHLSPKQSFPCLNEMITCHFFPYRRLHYFTFHWKSAKSSCDILSNHYCFPERILNHSLVGSMCFWGVFRLLQVLHQDLITILLSITCQSPLIELI